MKYFSLILCLLLLLFVSPLAAENLPSNIEFQDSTLAWDFTGPSSLSSFQLYYSDNQTVLESAVIYQDIDTHPEVYSYNIPLTTFPEAQQTSTDNETFTFKVTPLNLKPNVTYTVRATAVTKSFIVSGLSTPAPGQDHCTIIRTLPPIDEAFPPHLPDPSEVPPAPTGLHFKLGAMNIIINNNISPPD